MQILFFSLCNLLFAFVGCHLRIEIIGQVFDLLWSDPQHNEGCQPNGLRGAGTYFGPDVTQKFLRKYKLVFLVRSHECKHEGYEIMHTGKVIRYFTPCFVFTLFVSFFFFCFIWFFHFHRIVIYICNG